jgi:hypothetical protein
VLGGQVGQLARERAELLHLQLAAQPREPDQVGEAHVQVGLAGQAPGFPFLLTQPGPVHALPQVGAERGLHHRGERRGELLGQPVEALGHLGLTVPGLEKRLRSGGGHGRGQPGHALAHHPR